MNKEQMLDCINNLQEEEINLIEKKNSDYSSKDDALENLDICGEIGLISRMGDKVMRAKHIIERKSSKVKDEKLKDTLMDLANYANLLIVYREDRSFKERKFGRKIVNLMKELLKFPKEI